MKRFFVMFSAAVLVAASQGCASWQGQSSPQAAEQMVTLSDLVGSWSGSNSLWFMPGDPVRESDATARVEVASGGAVAWFHYTWSYEGKPQEGVLLVRSGSDAKDVSAVLVDSWHTGGKFMDFRDDDGNDGLVAVRGTYSAGEGPDWGWRIEVQADGADAFRILMFNITPDGQEAPAVAAKFTRTGSR